MAREKTGDRTIYIFKRAEELGFEKATTFLQQKFIFGMTLPGRKFKLDPKLSFSINVAELGTMLGGIGLISCALLFFTN